NNTTGISNTALGSNALADNTSANSNTAVGNSALSSNTAGSSNIAIGDSAGINLTTGSNNIDIGNKGKAGESNYMRIGTKGTHTHTLIAGISGATVAAGRRRHHRHQWSSRYDSLLRTFQGSGSADGQGERSDPGAETRHLPLQA